MNEPISTMRIPYKVGTIEDGSLDDDPFVQFERWFEEVRATDISEANAFILATVDAHNAADARTVLMKGVDDRGLLFYTNYSSDKGSEIGVHPEVCALFYWPTLQRQVRWRGRAERLTPDESDAYYHARPRGSQIGAHASPQSQPVPNRDVLEDRFREAEKSFEDVEIIPRPDTWGGYRIIPTTIEFWQGRENRLHDRFRYSRDDRGDWSSTRLAP